MELLLFREQVTFACACSEEKAVVLRVLLDPPVVRLYVRGAFALFFGVGKLVCTVQMRCIYTYTCTCAYTCIQCLCVFLH